MPFRNSTIFRIVVLYCYELPDTKVSVEHSKFITSSVVTTRGKALREVSGDSWVS